MDDCFILRLARGQRTPRTFVDIQKLSQKSAMNPYLDRGLNVMIRLPYLYPSFTRLNVVQNEESKDAAQMYRKFLEILESPLHDVVLKGSARRDWLAHCEEMLQQAMNLLKSSTSCSLVYYFCYCKWSFESV